MQDARSDVNVLRVRRTLEPKEKTADDAVLTEVWECMRPKLTETTKNTLRNVLFFSHATNIQRLTIPVFCREGSSVMVEASTGSGKTLSFLLPIIHRIIKENDRNVEATGLPILTKKISALVLSPNKTLSRQTYAICRQLANGAEHNIKVAIWGDTKIKPEKEIAKFNKMTRGGGNIIVTTPQTMVKMLTWCRESGNKSVQFMAAPLLVLDEADVILDKQHQLMNDLLGFMPKNLFYGLFGATVTSTKSVADFVKSRSFTLQDVPQAVQSNSIVPLERDEDDNVIDSPDLEEDSAVHRNKIYRIVDKQSTLINLRNCHVFVPAKQSISMLIYLLNKHPKKKHFIFFNNAETLEYIEALLAEISSHPEQSVLWSLVPYALHLGMSEARRSERFQEFLRDERGVLLSTDVCAFGIDVREVDYVLHFQPPVDARVYTHRIGRTGRMGCVGTSVLLLPLEQREELRPFLAELDDAFKSEEYKCPAHVFDASPLVSDILASDANLNSLAINAGLKIMQEQSGPSLRAALCSLGIDESLADSVIASQQDAPEEPPAPENKNKKKQSAAKRPPQTPASGEAKKRRLVKKKKK